LSAARRAGSRSRQEEDTADDDDTDDDEVDFPRSRRTATMKESPSV
jgi:hypothetical protein